MKQVKLVDEQNEASFLLRGYEFETRFYQNSIYEI